MYEGVLAAPNFQTYGSQIPRHSEIDKFEDSNYKEVLKKAAEKKQNRQVRVLSSCRYCLENSLLKEHEVLTVNSNFYTLQPNRTSFAGRHVLLVPLDHVSSSAQLNGSEQAMSIFNQSKRDIVGLFKDQLDCSVLIYETAVNFNSVPHCRIEFLAYPSEFDNQIPLFFEMAFRDLGGEWSTHQRSIKIQRSKGGLAKQIPPKFEYCYVEWGCNDDAKPAAEQEDQIGLCHIVEDPEKFNRNFFYEVLGSALEQDILIAKAPSQVDDEKMKQFKAWFRGNYSDFKKRQMDSAN